MGLGDDVFRACQQLKIKIWESAFGCEHVLTRRGQAGALVCNWSNWFKKTNPPAAGC